MKCKILDGKKFAEESYIKLKVRSANLLEKIGRKPNLQAIIIGNDPASKTYVGMKERACLKNGVETKTHQLSENVTTNEVIDLVHKLNSSPEVDGILMQHPAPKHINEIECFNTISLEKDVDGVTTAGYGRLSMGINAFGSCTPLGIMRLLDYYNIELQGLNALVVGRSQILGKPMAAMLLNANATVTIAHSKTLNLSELLKEADLIVAAVGVPRFIKSSSLKKGTILVDAGYHPTENCGDVDLDGIEQIASAFTPVPGGVGPMTINTLIYNTISAMEMKFSV
mgnify:FL=1